MDDMKYLVTVSPFAFLKGFQSVNVPKEGATVHGSPYRCAEKYPLPEADAQGLSFWNTIPYFLVDTKDEANDKAYALYQTFHRLSSDGFSEDVTIETIDGEDGEYEHFDVFVYNETITQAERNAAE